MKQKQTNTLQTTTTNKSNPINQTHQNPATRNKQKQPKEQIPNHIQFQNKQAAYTTYHPKSTNI